MTTPADYSPQDLVHEAKALIAEHGATDAAFQGIAERLKRLAARDDLKEIGQHRGRGVNAVDSYVLYRDPAPDGPIIILAQFDKATPIHNHGTWGVMCAYEGRERYTQWRRMDDGSTPGKAALELVADRVLEEGDLVWWPDVPNDIHRQDPVDDSMWQLVFMGRNTIGGDDEHYDPETGTAWRSSLPPDIAASGRRG